jgi:hypothetical protein
MAATARQARLPRIAWNRQRAGGIQCGKKKQNRDRNCRKQRDRRFFYLESHSTCIHLIASWAAEVFGAFAETCFSAIRRIIGAGSKTCNISVSQRACDHNHIFKNGELLVRLGCQELTELKPE